MKQRQFVTIQCIPIVRFDRKVSDAAADDNSKAK